MHTILYTLGICLVGLAFFLVFPALLEATLHTNDWQVFALTSFLCLFVGGCLILVNKRDSYTMSTRHVYLLTTVLWVFIPIVSGLPFYFTSTSYHLGFTDAVFEAVSGMTTTGSTVYANLDNAPKGILLWRSMVVWIGGMGIIVLTMIVLPYLRVGGMQLFRTESSDRSDKVLPKAHQVAFVTTISYIALSGLCALAYYLSGMTGFDAINHAMTTLATGGFSTHDASFGYFKNPLIHWMGVLFMMLGATPMLLYYTFFTNRHANRPLLYQTVVFWLQVAIIVFIVTVYVHRTEHMPYEEALRLTAFNIVSVATTTGYASTDYNQWGPFAIIVFYFLTVIGGCTGSTSGGLKTFRMVVMVKSVLYQMKKMLVPHGVFSARMGDTVIKEDVMSSVGMFFLLYVFVFTVFTLCLAASGLDMLTSTSGVTQAMSGVGPGLGPIIGPAGNFIPLTDFAKWSLVFAMIAGRLEIMTILVLFTRAFWRS